MGIQNLNKDKRGLQFNSAFYALIAMSLVIIAVGSWVGNWNSDYNSNVNYDLQDYNKLNDLSSIASKERGNLSITSSSQTTDFEGTSIRGAFGILNNIYESFNMVFGKNGMLASLSSRFNIPSYLILAIVSIMIFAITSALIAIFFRLPRSAA